MPGHEVEAAQFELLMDRLEEAGYIQYEISNWSRNGRVSRHNSKYWSAADVYALGVSAHGVIDGTRYANPRDLEKYLGGETGYAGNPQSAVASARSRIGEIMMLASRRVDGVAWCEINGWIQSWIGEPLDFDARSFYRSELRRMTEDGLLVDSKNQLRLTRRGILLADEVAQTFF
ncbi:hypothetical protein HYR69_09020 [Candidatus Sumerlaeota bacterium]|nr:hypothetical protein [Candidatus Sumerlaeota bacterium]